MKKLNTPSERVLLPRKNRIRAIQELYHALSDYVKENEEKWEDALGINSSDIAQLKALLEDNNSNTGILKILNDKVDSSSLASVATSGDYTDLTNTPTIPTVPTDVSAFNNDANYISNNGGDVIIPGAAAKWQWKDLRPDGYESITIDGINIEFRKAIEELDEDNPAYNFAYNLSLGYDQRLYFGLEKLAYVSEMPTVPTDISAFTNDAGYLTQHQDLSSYALKSEVPSIWTGTQAEYDALETVNETTIYIIKES